MTWWEILIIIAVAAFVVGYIVWAAVRRKRGNGCAGCSACRKPPEDTQCTHDNLHKS